MDDLKDRDLSVEHEFLRRLYEETLQALIDLAETEEEWRYLRLIRLTDIDDGNESTPRRRVATPLAALA